LNPEYALSAILELIIPFLMNNDMHSARKCDWRYFVSKLLIEIPKQRLNEC
jgi:hypothetical protein